MDYSIIVLTCCFAIIARAAHIPEVYESNGHKQTQDKFEQPPGFNYQEYQQTQKGNQFDPQRIRYQQQQQLDTKPREAKSTELSTENSRPQPSTAPATRVGLEDLEKDSPQTRVPKSRIAKKSLKPNSYQVNEAVEPAGNRQDDSGYINYVDRGPKTVSQNLGGFSVAPTGGDQLSALSSLLGQTPENQLHGLQQLLNDRGQGQLRQQHQHQGGYYKDHTPIREDVYDIANTQNKPNIKVQHQVQGHNNHVVNQALQSLNKHGNGPEQLKSLQAQLDANASAHAETILAQAQKKALEHVKLQHEAIARAQKQAELAALEQIKAQNEAIAREHAQAEQEAEEKRQAEAKEERKKAAERRRQHEQARERARIAALAYKHKQEQEKKEKEDPKDNAHSVAQNTRAKNAHKHKKFHTAEPAETQNHYFTAHAQQPHYTPVQLFPQVAAAAAPIRHAPVHHTPAVAAQTASYEYKPKAHQEDHAEVDKYYNTPQFTVIGHTKNAHGEQELQYAANYEFGYRIRDYDHGNDYGHQETKDGETTKGEYHALLPDGRTQTVTYYVDDSGYHAEVSYGGETTHH